MDGWMDVCMDFFVCTHPPHRLISRKRVVLGGCFSTIVPVVAPRRPVPLLLSTITMSGVTVRGAPRTGARRQHLLKRVRLCAGVCSLTREQTLTASLNALRSSLLSCNRVYFSERHSPGPSEASYPDAASRTRSTAPALVPRCAHAPLHMPLVECAQG